MRDLGLLPPDSVARRVDREMFLLAGGAAALLLQVAHPLVAAGVVTTYDFRPSTTRRLQQSVDSAVAVTWPIAALTAGLLPPPLRDAFGLRWGTAERLAFRAAIVSLRYLRGTLPDRLTVVPQARRWEATADERPAQSS